jgi:putative phosphoesterase
MLSDIHGNRGALHAMLEAARKAQVEHLLIAGDLVGYYYDAAGVLAELAPWARTVIGGNHERLLREARQDPASADSYRRRYGSALDVALETMTPEDADWLCALPAQAEVELGGAHFLLCHGSPNDQDEYVYPTADVATIARCLRTGRVVVSGHTHYPMIAAGKDALLVNAGSVGQARDFGGFASWALFDTDTRLVAPQRSEYAVSALQDEVRRRDPHLPYLADVLVRNRMSA